MEQHRYWPHRLVSPIWVSIQEAGDECGADCIYDEAAQYVQDIICAMQEFRTEEYPSSNLMNYFSLPNDPEMETAIREKVRAAQLSACVICDRLYSAVDLDLSADLTKEEVIALTEQLETQFTDGWGAEFEVVNIPVAGNMEIAARIGNMELDLCPVEVAKFIAEDKIETRQMGQTMQ